MKDYHEAYHQTKMQAQIWKQEARGANHTIGAIYQLCTGAKGEPGNWNGAEPVRKVVEELDKLRAVAWAAQGLLTANEVVHPTMSREEAVRAADAKLRQALGKWQMEFTAAKAT